MARSKEQWKAQQKRAMHTQPKSNSFFQIQRPGALPRPSALSQLGKPATGAPSAAVATALSKPEPIQIARQSDNSMSQVIDLTLDDDEEEDEPMGASVTSQLVTSAPVAPVAAVVSSAASGAVKLSMLDGVGREDLGATQLPLQTDTVSEMMVPLAEDVESDVDEDWPTVPSSVASSVPSPQNLSAPEAATTPLVSQQLSHDRTTEEVGAALDAICRTIPFSQGGQQAVGSAQNAQVDESARHDEQTLYGSGDEEMEADVDEELPTHGATTAANASSSKTASRIVRVENLEDGEIFEEGAAPKSSMAVQRAVMLEHQDHFNPQTVDTLGIRPHLRNKKQKKRGKKKTKRKLETMQMMHGAPGEVPVEFERATRQRPFPDAPPPGQYTIAMMRNGPRGEPMNARPVFQDPQQSSFRPGGLPIGGLLPPRRLPVSQMAAPPLPPPPYEDSQILRVNRQGSMEMLDGGVDFPSHAMFAEPPRYGGFKYRSVSMSPPTPVSTGSRPTLQRTHSSDQPPLHFLPTSDHAAPSNSAANKTTSDSDGFDLASLRAAALRSKAKRPAKTLTPTIQKEPEVQDSVTSPSSPRRTAIEKRNSEPTSPEIDKLRLEILRSMTRNRKRGVTKTPSKGLAPPASKQEAAKTPEANEQPSDRSSEDNGGRDGHSSTEGGGSVPNKIPEASPPKDTAADTIECTVIDGSSCETDKSTTTSEQNEIGDKMDSPSASTSELLNTSAEVIAKTPEFRPLTACSQSVVIRLNLEDFSPRKGGNDTHATSSKAKASSSVQDAIKKLRQEIAERERKQISRLLENAVAKLLKQPFGTGSSSSAASSSLSPKQVSPGQNSNAGIAKPPDVTISPKVNITARSTLGESVSGTVAGEVDVQGSTDEVSTSAKVIEQEIAEVLPSPDTRASAEMTAGQDVSSAVIESAALDPQGQSDTSGVSTFVDIHVFPTVLQQASSDGRNGNPASESCGNSVLETTDGVPVSNPLLIHEQNDSSGDSNPASRMDELDFDAIRAEYEQCVAECEEAEMNITRLSNEMAQLEKTVASVESTVGGS